MNDELARELLRLEEIADRCGVRLDMVRRFARLGVIEPAEDERDLYPVAVVVRVERAVRLRRDLGVAPRDAALVLDLLERIEALEARLERLSGG